MIKIIDMGTENTFGFRVDGKVEKSDIQQVFGELLKRDELEKFNLYVEVGDFNLTDVTAEALKEDIRLWFKNPGLPLKIAKTALVTDSSAIKTGFNIESALLPTMTGKAFSSESKAEAINWLVTDHREPKRLDLTISELAETSVLKAAAGFGIGLLTASLFGTKTRKSVGLALLAGSIVAGIPLAAKVLNNNRQLIGK